MFEIRELQFLTNQNPANRVPCGIQIPLHLLEPMTFVQFIRVCLQQNGVQFEEVAAFGVPLPKFSVTFLELSTSVKSLSNIEILVSPYRIIQEFWGDQSSRQAGDKALKDIEIMAKNEDNSSGNLVNFSLFFVKWDNNLNQKRSKRISMFKIVVDLKHSVVIRVDATVAAVSHLFNEVLFNNYSSSPSGRRVNSLWGQSPNGLLTQRTWVREE